MNERLQVIVMKKLSALLVAGFLVFGIVGSAMADPILWTGNSHYYELVEADGITWNAARAAAEAQTYLDVSGHLATITDAFEHDFIVQNSLPGQSTRHIYYLGGFQSASASGSEPDGGWGWITGEPWVYTNWSVNNPDDGAGSNQDVLAIYGNPINVAEYTYWDDAWADYTLHVGGYIVEYPTVPVPGAFLLAMIGLSVAGVKLRKHG